MHIPIPIVVLALVFIFIAVRKVGNMEFQIWQIMSIGAVAVIATGQISVVEALKSVKIDVMIFLFSMFVIGVALERSRYLSHLSYNLFKRARNIEELLLFILFGMGFTSALLMNDTIAIIGTPVVLHLAKKHNINPKVLLIALAFAITIGSVMSPIGNPQNFLIATQGKIENPFLTFLRYLAIPTLINLLLAFVLLKFFYKEHFNNDTLKHSQEPIREHQLALLSKISVIILLILISVKVFISLTRYIDGHKIGTHNTYISSADFNIQQEKDCGDKKSRLAHTHILR